MKHIEENELVLYHYQEPCDRASIERHLAGCAACRAGYQALRLVLGAVETRPVPERDDAYGARVWQRIGPRLGRRRGLAWGGWREWLRPQRLAPVAAMAVLLVAAFLAGRYWPRTEAPVAGDLSPQQVRERILLVEVGEHLERSKMILVELVNAPAGGGLDISAKQERAEDLVASSRLYRQTAAEAGDAGVTLVLEDLERVLLEIARSPSNLSAAELERFRQRIESQDILFKVRVVEFQVRERAKEIAPAPALARTEL